MGHGIPARGATPGMGVGKDGVLWERRIGPVLVGNLVICGVPSERI